MSSVITLSDDMYIERVPVDGTGEYNAGGYIRRQVREGRGGYVLKER